MRMVLELNENEFQEEKRAELCQYPRNALVEQRIHYFQNRNHVENGILFPDIDQNWDTDEVGRILKSILHEGIPYKS